MPEPLYAQTVQPAKPIAPDQAPRAPTILAPWKPHEAETCRHLWAIERGGPRCFHCHWTLNAIRRATP